MNSALFAAAQIAVIAVWWLSVWRLHHRWDRQYEARKAARPAGGGLV